MLRQFDIHLPSKINTQIHNAMKKHNIMDEVNLIRIGDFDVFTIGHDGLPHIRIANVFNKWQCSVIDPHRLDDGGDVLEEFSE